MPKRSLTYPFMFRTFVISASSHQYRNRFLKPFFRSASIVHTLKGRKGSKVLPRVHKAVSLLKRWLMGTHQGAVSHEHLDYYLDEFTFRFNRRTSRYRGKLFFRLLQNAVTIDPAPYKTLVKGARGPSPKHHNR